MKDYSPRFRKAVQAILMMALKDSNNNPRHPEAPFHALPIELLVLILEYLAADEGLFHASLTFRTDFSALRVRRATSVPLTEYGHRRNPPAIPRSDPTDISGI